MRCASVVSILLLLAAVSPVRGQTSSEELQQRIEAAERSQQPDVLLRAASAARLLGDFDGATDLLRRATTALDQVEDSWVSEVIFQAIASGRGVDGMQRALREARKRVNLTPQEIADVTGNYPSLLRGGEFDDIILSLRPDHPDSLYACECLPEKAWVHRVAGRRHESRRLWGELVAAWDRNPLQFDDPDQQADWQARYARNLARAGRSADARAALDKAMSMPVSDDERPAVQRRWAQTYAELGEVEKAVELLEPLIASSTLVTVNSLSTRYTWEPVRNTLVFQEMLARHR
jgi:tetratricopeptide (TPR) repeat protein